MIDASVRERVERLRAEINRHNHLYFVLDQPDISDADYDALMVELRGLEEQRPELVTLDSPTQRVGAPPAEGFAEVVHPRPMLSLANAFNDDELAAWRRRATNLLDGADFEMVCELKIDGLAVALTYEDGVFVHGATRGDGYRGEDVTRNLRTIRSIPLSVPPEAPRRFEVRGEVYFPRSLFDKLNEERAAQGQPTYANPRNTAAGSLRQLDSRITAQRALDIFVYSVYNLEAAEYDPIPDNQWQTLDYLKSLGFKVNPLSALCRTLEEAESYYRRWVEEAQALDYGADGVVVKVNPVRLQESLGNVGREPRWAIAYKFPATQVVTRLLDIGVNVGRTGSLNPYAVLEPVDVAGATVKMATLHNEDYIRRKDLREGDLVVLERAGEVIPQVVRPLVERRTGEESVFSMPEHCHRCSTPVVRPQGQAVTICPNPTCPAKLQELLKHFVSRGAMDIEGMGEKMCQTLIDAGLVKDIADVYSISKEDLLNLERMAEKGATNIINAIEASKERSLSRVIFALGIPHVGSEVADILAGHFGSMNRLSDASESELVKISGVSSIIAKGIAGYFQNDGNSHVIEKLQGKLRTPSVPQDEKAYFETGQLRLAGMQFVVTGKLSSMTRSQAEARIKALGGAVASSVSRKTRYLVAGEEAGSKLDQANKLGIATISEEQFLQMIDATSAAKF